MGVGMVVRKRTGATAERFVEVTLELIEEQGGSQNVSLREVARRVGCAPTNVYNYFDGFDGLLWEALRRAVAGYAQTLGEGLDDGMAPLDYFGHVIGNYVAYPQQHPGLYRFISLDPVNDGDYPGDVLETVEVLVAWLVDVIVACAPGTSRADAENAVFVIDAYISGESASLITGRALPGTDIAQRMLDNSVRLFTLLTAYDETAPKEPVAYPQLELPLQPSRPEGR
jgi:AcrR family transcriptional regulator